MFVLKIVFNMNKGNTLATASSEQHGGCEQASETPTRPGGGRVTRRAIRSNLDWISSFFFFLSHVSHKSPHTQLTFNKIKAPPPVIRACNTGIDFNEVY